MKKFFENILARSTIQIIAIIASSFIIPFLLFWQYFLKSDLIKKEQLSENIDIQKSKVLYQSKLANNLPKAKKEQKELASKLMIALSELPDSKEIPELLSSISRLAKQSGLEIELFQPTGEELNGFYAKVPVKIIAKGSFHQVVKFFEQVGKLTRIVNISSIKMYQPEIIENRMLITTDCTATTFRFLEESERIKVDKEKENKKRRKR